MYDPISLIPEDIDPKLKQMVTILIIVQFTAFVILMIYLVYTHIKRKSKNDINATDDLLKEYEETKEVNIKNKKQK